MERRCELICRHYEDMLTHYGIEMGVRCARKHLGWYLETAASDGIIAETDVPVWRAKLCREDESSKVLKGLKQLFAAPILADAA